MSKSKSSTVLVRKEMHRALKQSQERARGYKSNLKDRELVAAVAAAMGAARIGFNEVPTVWVAPGEVTIYVSCNIASFTEPGFVKALARIDEAVPFEKTSDYPEYANRTYRGSKKAGAGLVKVEVNAWLKDADDQSKNCRRVLKDVQYERRPVYEFVCS